MKRPQRRPRSVRASDSMPTYFSRMVVEARRFYLPIKPGGESDVMVVSGGKENCRPDYDIKRTWFPYTVLEFVHTGTGWLELAGQRHALRPGMVFVYGHHTPIHIQTDPAAPTVKYFAVLSGRETLRILRFNRLAPGTVAMVSPPDAIQRVFEDLIDFGLSDHPDREESCSVTIRFLIAKIARTAIPADATEQRAFASYVRCRQFVEQHGEALVRPGDMARACHLDQAYMCRLFRRFGRESPGQYLQHLLMNRAAELIVHSQLMIKEISDRLGFKDPFHFSRAFRKTFGIAPSRMRSSQPHD